MTDCSLINPEIAARLLPPQNLVNIVHPSTKSFFFPCLMTQKLSRNSVEPGKKWPKLIELSGHPKNDALILHYLRTDWAKILKFDWWVVIDVYYILTKEFLFFSKFFSTSILIKNSSNLVARFLPIFGLTKILVSLFAFVQIFVN